MQARTSAPAILLLATSWIAPLPAGATFCSDLVAGDPDVVVCDAADNPSYGDIFGWESGDSGEVGFPPSNIEGGSGSWDFGGSAARTVADGPPEIDTSDLSWRIATSSVGLAHTRFAEPLEVGDTLRVRWSGEDLVDDQRIGISLHSGATCQGTLFSIERVECSGLPCFPARLTDATRNDETVLFGVPAAAEITFTLTSPTTYTLAAQPLPAGTPDTLTGGGTIQDLPIRGVCLRVTDAPAGITDLVGFFNRITVTRAAPEPRAFLAAFAAWAALVGVVRARHTR